jgi:hypothetical protein
MKKRILVVGVLQFFLVLNSCSSDSGDNSTTTPETPVVVIKTAKVTSYSKNSGETGETISIYGENFSDKVSDIKITFDGVAATIVSSTATEIVFKLPSTVNLLPKLLLTIENRTINNEVKNDYNGNIGILPIPSSSGWFTIDNVLKIDKDIKRVRMLSDKIFYCSLDNYVYRTLDGGISWMKWAYNYDNQGDFYPTKKGDGLCYTGFGIIDPFARGVIAIPSEGNQYSSNVLWQESGGSYPGINSIYIDENMQNGTLVSQKGAVYTNKNGGKFELVYDSQVQNSDSKMSRIYMGAQIDNDHIWTIGEKVEGSTNYPVILFKNNMTDGWKQHLLKNEPSSAAYEIYFADIENGFILVINATERKIYKTINGGDTWSKVYTGEKFTKFTFKDANTGWAVLDNKIYKTINGGSVWTLDYTHDQSIRTIAYKNNVVWAISTDKIIKRYL